MIYFLSFYIFQLIARLVLGNLSCFVYVDNKVFKSREIITLGCVWIDTFETMISSSLISNFLTCLDGQI